MIFRGKHKSFTAINVSILLGVSRPSISSSLLSVVQSLMLAHLFQDHRYSLKWNSLFDSESVQPIHYESLEYMQISLPTMTTNTSGACRSCHQSYHLRPSVQIHYSSPASEQSWPSKGRGGGGRGCHGEENNPGGALLP